MEEVDEEGDVGFFGSVRKALILRDETMSYSSIRYFRSSFEVIVTNASKSCVGS